MDEWRYWMVAGVLSLGYLLLLGFMQSSEDAYIPQLDAYLTAHKEAK